LPGETIGDRSDLAALANGAAVQQGQIKLAMCYWLPAADTDAA